MTGQRARFSVKSIAAACAFLLAGVPALADAQPRPGPWYSPTPYAPAPASAYQGSYGYSRPTSSRHDILSNDAHSWPILRASNGVGLHVARGAPLSVSFDFDVAAGYRWAFHRRAYLVFEGGYSYSTEPSFGGHFAAVGLGPELYLNRFVGIGWTPKFVIGETWRDLGYGVRNTLNVPILMRVFNLEIGHQYLRVGGSEQHEVRAQIGVDLAATAQLVLWLLVSPGY
jgi:hypothetical protein